MEKMNINDFGFERQILEQLPTPVMAVNKEFEITYGNRTLSKIMKMTQEELVGKHCYDVFNSEHCNTENCCMKLSYDNGEMNSARNSFTLDGTKTDFEYYSAPLRDSNDEIVGGLEYIIDITDRVMKEKRLEQQSRTIRELSTPTIKLWEGVLVLPVVGIIDSVRAQYMMESMLKKILETSSKVIILDIHGVAAVDTAVANHLIKITKATKLMGCECLLSGISPAVAQTIIQLGIDMSHINTSSTLSDALKKAFTMIDLVVKQTEEV